jgi:Zn-finger domain-containing protein
MNYKSSEIEQLLFDKQIQTYTRIMDLINHDFDNMDEERLSILLRNCIDMFGDIQIHIKNMKSREMYY